ncbi:MAG TPA: twin-arginine translocation signal domain-containing protein, partial [Chloroflexota bacterium]|nr:twin-arginine translocation signal domain-containing protein [Chloroflexota bacterium]
MTALSRRRFLQLCAVTTSGLALSVACGQQAPSAPAKPAEPAKPADSTAAKPAAPTAVPTIAAAVAPQTQATAAPAAPTAAPAAKPAAAAGPSGQVTVIQQLPITTLNANMEQSLANLNPSIHMADPLVFREPNGSVKPHLATAWSYPDEKTLRFKVRQG